MTDDKSKNPEDEFAEFEDDFGEEELEEDFSEEGEEFVEEDWEAFDDEGDFPVADEGGKKSSKLLVIVGGLVLLGGGGFAAMQFMGGGPASQMQTALPAADNVADSLPVPDADMSGTDNSGRAADKSGTASQNALSAPPATEDFTPPPSDPELDFEMPMPFSNNNESGDVAARDAGGQATTARPPRNMDSGQASSDIEQQPLTPLPQDSDAADEAPGLMASGDSADGMQKNVDTSGGGAGNNIPAWSGSGSQAANAANASQAAAIDSSALKSLENKLDRLFSRIDNIERELDQIKKSGSGDSDELQSQIQKLQREISNIDKRPAPAKQPSRTDTSSQKTSSPAKQSSSAATGGLEANASDWIMTSAQPGKATLRKVGGSDVISIQVGDSVSGLGQIVSIGLENGKWVVKATSGRVSQ